MDISKKNVSSVLKRLKEHKISPMFVKKFFKNAIKEGLDINIKYEQGKNVLHYAIESGYNSLLKVFLKLGCNPNVCCDSFLTPLHLAVLNNNRKSAKILLKSGCDVDSPGEFEQTPLHIATISGDLKMIKLLILYNADIQIVDEKNFSVIDYAKDENNTKIKTYLEKIKIKKGEN